MLWILNINHNKKARLTQGLCVTVPSFQSKMAVSRYLGFYRTANSAIWSDNAENPCLDQTRSGSDACEIFAFKLYCDLETRVRGQSRSSKAALFDRVHTTLYSASIVTMPLIYYRFRDIAAYWSKIANPLIFGALVGGKAIRFVQQPLVAKN